MEQSFELGFDAKILSELPRHRPPRNIDPYAVQPWQKNTLEISLHFQPQPKTYKTFYQSPVSRTKLQDRKYSTHRAFNFKKDRELEITNRSKEAKSVLHATSRGTQSSSVNHYNINGSFLGELNLPQKPKFLNGLFTRWTKEKPREKKLSNSLLTGLASIREIKHRINANKINITQEDISFLRLNSQSDLQASSFSRKSPVIKQKKRSKVISIGLARLSSLKLGRNASENGKF